VAVHCISLIFRDFALLIFISPLLRAYGAPCPRHSVAALPTSRKPSESTLGVWQQRPPVQGQPGLSRGRDGGNRSWRWAFVPLKHFKN